MSSPAAGGGLSSPPPSSRRSSRTSPPSRSGQHLAKMVSFLLLPSFYPPPLSSGVPSFPLLSFLMMDDRDFLNCCVFSGRGYLDNVQLVSARRGDGVPASWVQTCSCPPGYEGDFCERCSAGFRRRAPADGAFSPCEPCSCRGGSCDPQTGDCYSADETPGEQSCSEGFYQDPWQPRTCVKCPCPDGVSCSLAAGSLEPRCDRCPTGTAGRSQGYYIDDDDILIQLNLSDYLTGWIRVNGSGQTRFLPF